METFITARDALINLFQSNTDLPMTFTTGRAIPISDPHAEVVDANDEYPLGIVSVQRIEIENDVRNEDKRRVEIQVDIIEKASWSGDSRGRGDIELDKTLDNYLSKVIEVVQKNQTFLNSELLNEAEVKVHEAYKRTAGDNPIIGIASILIEVSYSQAIVQDDRSDVEGLSIPTRG